MLTVKKLLLIISLSVIGCAPVSKQAVSVQVGTLQPPRALTTEKKFVSLSQFRGQVVLLNLWASWCGQCVYELPALERLHKSLSGQGFSVVAVAVSDEITEVQGVQSRHSITFPLLVDYNSEFESHFNPRGLPAFFMLDAQGAISAFRDPESGKVVTKLIGVRKWDSPEAKAAIEESLTKVP